MHIVVELGANGSGYPRMTMAHIEDRDSPGKIDVTAILLVPHFGVFGASDENGQRSPDAAGDREVTAIQQFDITSHGASFSAHAFGEPPIMRQVDYPRADVVL